MARTALWQSIATTLTAEIAAGHYRPGDRLPSEGALATRFGVNRHTVRHALARMATEGLVLSRRGAGVFVAATPTDYPLGRRVRFHRNLAASGKVPGREILSIETRASDATEAQALRIAPGAPVHVCEGLSLADGQPIALFRSVFPAATMPGLPALLRAQQSVTRALSDLGIADYTRFETRITAQLATAVQAIHLRVQEGDPILRTVAINTAPGGQPVEYGTTWFAGDRITLTLREETEKQGDSDPILSQD
ncbi:MAG: phosphonate metabolism transcriptional regulator PhnF [Rhodobacterales bacterium]|nr:phosphonate metabolism transcriptional regulator PhnF [Rhodobacterales bacterium]NCT12765.1 phosphonate metabolism transcriptional regulator PhnF [Rhodobacterales bacterium]